ncbi:MAG: TIGR02450 family Trp-rich protein [Pseudomonadota bacterium]|nr:TIGR02450 family Trp-rich protein [Pseudomonadota bacterium]
MQQKRRAVFSNRFNPEKLLNSKWTAVNPVFKERHFLVTKLITDESEQVHAVILEAVINHHEYRLPVEKLKETSNWMQGWK